MERAFNPDFFVARWFCSRVGPEDMPKFAADALEAGHDGSALRRLAGLVNPTSRDVGNLFRDALQEISTVKVYTKEQAVLTLSRIAASDIIEGRIDPFSGANMLALYAGMLRYPPFLVEFLQLSEMPQWGEYAPSREKLIQAIIDQSRMLLSYLPE